MNFVQISLLVLVSTWVSSAQIKEADYSQRGPEILKGILAQEWAASWKEATLERIRRVAAKPDMDDPTGLPPVWVAEIKGPAGKAGHLMWDSEGEGQLVEFALDDKLAIPGAVLRVPGLQEFPIKNEDGMLVASGCVPTAAASLVSYWAANGFPKWRGPDAQTPREIALRLRGQLSITLYPDNDGYSENRMALAGASMGQLAAVLRKDARKYEVPMRCQIEQFTMERLKEEVKAGRPSLVSCVVRVAHLPQLSWPHAVVTVAWEEVDGVELVGVVDNFYPTKHPETIRWIRKEAFLSLVTLRPLELDQE